MGKDDKKKPRFKPDIDASRINEPDKEDNDKPDEKIILPPITSGFIDSLGFQDDEESAELYREALRRAPGFPWSHDDEEMDIEPDLQAPFLSGADAASITPEQIVAGVYINVPRSSKLWTGDHIKLVWGNNTFYTTLDSGPHNKVSRLIQYLNSEQLADYQTGEVHVHYEVVRRSRLVGISKHLTINLEGEGRPYSSQRYRAIRRKRF